MTSSKFWPVSTCMTGNGRRRGPEGLDRQVQHDDRVLAAGEQQDGPLELGRDLADDVDGLGLQGPQVAQLVLPGGRLDRHWSRHMLPRKVGLFYQNYSLSRVCNQARTMVSTSRMCQLDRLV